MPETRRQKIWISQKNGCYFSKYYIIKFFFLCNISVVMLITISDVLTLQSLIFDLPTRISEWTLNTLDFNFDQKIPILIRGGLDSSSIT